MARLGLQEGSGTNVNVSRISAGREVQQCVCLLSTVSGHTTVLCNRLGYICFASNLMITLQHTMLWPFWVYVQVPKLCGIIIRDHCKT